MQMSHIKHCQYKLILLVKSATGNDAGIGEKMEKENIIVN